MDKEGDIKDDETRMPPKLNKFCGKSQILARIQNGRGARLLLIFSMKAVIKAYLLLVSIEVTQYL